jgi:hypothetical protein
MKMTGIHDKIIAEYGDADFNRRLHMYLQFPRLRSEFILIDQRNLNAELPAGLTSPRFSLAARMTVLFSSAAVGVKKLFGLASA